MTGKGEQPVYRCPKGGYHKFRRRTIWTVVGVIFKPKLKSVKVRRCIKCGTIYTASGRLR